MAGREPINPFFPTEVWPHVGLPRGRERGSIKWGCVEDPGRRDRASTCPYSLHPLPDSSQLFKLVTLHLPFTGTSPQAQVPGTQASP